MTNTDEEKEQFCSELNDLMQLTSCEDKLIVQGDFNAHVGHDDSVWCCILGKKAISKMNSNGLLFADDMCRALVSYHKHYLLVPRQI